MVNNFVQVFSNINTCMGWGAGSEDYLTLGKFKVLVLVCLNKIQRKFEKRKQTKNNQQNRINYMYIPILIRRLNATQFFMLYSEIISFCDGLDITKILYTLFYKYTGI